MNLRGLRFRPLARVWAAFLILVNLGALLFIDTLYGQVALAAVLAGMDAERQQPERIEQLQRVTQAAPLVPVQPRGAEPELEAADRRIGDLERERDGTAQHGLEVDIRVGGETVWQQIEGRITTGMERAEDGSYHLPLPTSN